MTTRSPAPELGCPLCRAYRADLLHRPHAAMTWLRQVGAARAEAFEARLRAPDAPPTTLLLDSDLLRRPYGDPGVHAEQMLHLAQLQCPPRPAAAAPAPAPPSNPEARRPGPGRPRHRTARAPSWSENRAPYRRRPAAPSRLRCGPWRSLAPWTPEVALSSAAVSPLVLLASRGDAHFDHRVSGSTVGKFHLGGPLRRREAGEGGWLVSTASRDVAADLARLLVLSPEKRPPGAGGATHELDTHRAEFQISLDGPQSLSLRMVMRGRSGMRTCDGVRLLEPTSAAGAACGCPPTWGERRALSRTGRGPKPEITVRFRLVEEPGIGHFDLQSSSWALVEDAHLVAAALAVRGSTTALLRIDRPVVTTPHGVEVVGRRPRLQLLGGGL
ncbi:Scr1 family TA system antitoxin-like transcriptional regulator [Kitasatospora sp. NPDC127116]|uniref:Scr1 family TA system antitoxin-like transcriptional regulator n=1 Tax=Kitasatospora sp. NPDC127116 TaxID=3345367 RepID=UPI0036401456